LGKITNNFSLVGFYSFRVCKFDEFVSFCKFDEFVT